MRAAVRLCRVEPEDCAPLAALHRTAFPARLVTRSIFVSPRVDRFLREIVRGDASGAHELVAAKRGAELCGYAWFRDLGSSWHLNHVAVDPDCRGAGIGSRLFERWVEGGRRRLQRRFTLDVTADNDLARDWYLRRGLAIVGRTRVLERPLAAGGEASRRQIEVLDREAADRRQATYGFSELALRQGARVWRVGRLGEELLRMKEPPTAELEAALSALEPGRRLLLLEPAGDDAVKPVELVLRLAAEGL